MTETEQLGPLQTRSDIAANVAKDAQENHDAMAVQWVNAGCLSIDDDVTHNLPNSDPRKPCVLVF